MDCEYTIIYIWRESVLEYFTLNIFCLSELLVFLELRSRKTTHVKKLLLYNFLRFYFSKVTTFAHKYTKILTMIRVCTLVFRSVTEI